MNHIPRPPAPGRFSDLLDVEPDGRPRVLPAVHHLPDLLDLDPEEILARFKTEQQRDFSSVIEQLHEPGNPLYALFEGLRSMAEQEPGNRFPETALFQTGALERQFRDLHDHVMEHPVWRHPFFRRVFAGRMTEAQLTEFAKHYFNQVKNTRQCVALALGRFSGLMELPYGRLNDRVSELSQIVLAQLLADEYGVGSHELEGYPSLAALFASTTHIVMYRKLFAGLGVPFEEQDVPMLHGVADNVLIQRIVAGDPAFSPLEALASVGLGMEWGVPEFFTLLLGGMIRYAWNNDVPLTADHLHVFIAHVKYDVLHAVSVMLVTSFHARDDSAIDRIENATNLLMAGRYAMMSDLYRHVFEEPCPSLAEAGLAERYRITDRRIEAALRAARERAAPASVLNAADYRSRADMPFVFA